MAVVVYRNAYVWINGVDLSASTREAALNYGSESLDNTAMGMTTRSHKGGLYDWSMDFTFHQDFSSGVVDGTLWNLVGTTTCVEFRPGNTCTTVNNPSYSGVCTLMKYNPMTGAVGSLLDVPANFVSAGTLNRSTTAT